ncbi:circularly permuted type 2 ATP-grasp protein [Marinomonas balearica]|uniref:Putative circularly permuted ATP-grasp superfamily protein n=1 Tax=Marinomonas balearica TaxID=491947 RepID=A0A4R6MAW9_9GAMM|nr:circularly permuted type 2 ATP-grasp protein [Marinomonas balearica]TDO97379.1 putative circularly permuted ATP-grasp superfamily protein [Marinomonas balearica]
MHTDALAPMTPEQASLDFDPASSKHYDEAFDMNGFPRDHWQTIIESFNALGAEGVADRQQRARRILSDDGATYNLTSDPLSPNVWGLDIVPYLIENDSWKALEQGMVQRSKLFDLIMKDLYGEQTLLKEGVIPSEIIFDHPGFLRACHGISVPHAQDILLHASDLVRDERGQYLIVGDRTQAPSGAGYAHENRVVLSRVMPRLFRTSRIKRLSHFFQTLRDTLMRIGKQISDKPRIVLLSEGANSKTYFEQAYLANYLGFPLVQGGDLTVRNGQVWMKSLNGLSPVDVIMRRINDDACDQAELKPNSLLGVPGLLEVARSGKVVIANPIGSGLLETPALMAFLPQISQFLLGEELSIATVKTYWCGTEENRLHVEANLSQLIIKPAMRVNGGDSYYGHTLDQEAKQALLDKIRLAPHRWVAQEYVSGAQLPVWADQGLKKRPSIMRMFTVADKDGFSVMPGGLSRVGSQGNERIVGNNISDTLSKDTWVLATDFESTLPAGMDSSSVQDIALQSNLPSRVIENLFWFGRYMERAEVSLRLMRTFFKQMNGVEPLPKESRDILLKAISLQTGCLPGFVQGDSSMFEEPNDELASLICDGARPGTIKSNLNAMLACGEQVKEMLSADTRIILNDLRAHIHQVDRAYANGLPELPEESLDNLVTSILALSGLNHESMLRGPDWMFQELGRRTERALQTAKLLKSTLTEPLASMQQSLVLESVLLSVEALISFRRRYRNRNRVAYGLDLLMADRTNPRSLIYQTEQLRKYLEELPRNESSELGLSPEKRMIIKSLNDIQLADLEMLAHVDEIDGERSALSDFMTQLTEQLERFTSHISDKYFDHAAGPQQLVPGHGEY